MKKCNKTFISILLCLCLVIFVGCTNSNSLGKSEDIKNTGTKSYYTKMGYVSLTVSNDLTAICDDIIYFDDGSMSINKGSTIKVIPKDNSYDNLKTTITSLNAMKILSGLKINGTLFSANELDFNNIVINSNTIIESVFSSFDILGVALTNKSSKLNNDETIFESDELIYAYFNDGVFDKNLTSDRIHKNTKCDVYITDSAIDFMFEADLQNTNLAVNLLLKTDKNEYYLYKLNENGNKTYSINLKNLENKTRKINIYLKYNISIGDL